MLHVGSGEKGCGGIARTDTAPSFETFVKDCVLRAGSGERCRGGIARADAGPSF